MTQPLVTIYSTPTCHYCNLAKEFFKTNNIQYNEINVGVDKDAARAMVAKTGQMGVPVIEVGTEVIVGFQEEKLRELLNVQ
jgi:glutaredoxin-like YruB-family protein